MACVQKRLDVDPHPIDHIPGSNSTTFAIERDNFKVQPASHDTDQSLCIDTWSGE